LPDAPAIQTDLPNALKGRPGGQQPPSASLRDLWQVVIRRRRLVGSIVCGLLLLCLLYCLVAPNQYDASAKVALRIAPASSLNLEGAETFAAASILSTPLQLETLANVFRSDQLAWRVITDPEIKLYQSAAFSPTFSRLFPGYRVETRSPQAEAWLLERFQRRLHVQTLPRTLIVEIRFRSKDPVLAAAVVNALIREYGRQETEGRMDATAQASNWLEGQLRELKAQVDQSRQRLTAFQTEHGIMATPETQTNGEPGESLHNATLVEIDELGRQLVAVSADRILREAEFRAASQGDPELVAAANSQTEAQSGGVTTALIQQLRTRRSDLEQEQSQLSLEHGPNFPRVVEIRRQMQDIDAQIQTADSKLVERFRGAWQAAAEREKLVRQSLDEHTAEGLRFNEAVTQYAVLRQEAIASQALYSRVVERIAEAGLAAGVHAPNIIVVDPARQPVKPVAPDPPLYLAITLFAGLWLAVGGALVLENHRPAVARAAVALLAALLVASFSPAQAPTPTTSGLPSGVPRPQTEPDNRKLPNPKDAPAVWDQAAPQPVQPAPANALDLTPMPAPIGPGDLLDISEFHTPEFHSSVRVSPTGSVTLPMVNEVHLEGLDEQGAAHAIEQALLAQGMLLHPRVSVVVTAYVGQDVSVLGEVIRPGVYPFTLHHRLLDLISAASGLAPTAGRLVNVFHRDDPRTPHPVVLDPGGTDTSADHNPELAPGDTVQVSRAGLVYVIGDVVRPGGFAVDPAQGLTVVQALSLAWGPSENAATGRALLIREQKGGRTMTTLNLSHMLHGQEPDQPIRDRDILFVPDSTAKNLLNKSLETAIQSAIGVTIYAGLVYSQRF
jgi:polysaccharide export outer membrane protein